MKKIMTAMAVASLLSMSFGVYAAVPAGHHHHAVHHRGHHRAHRHHHKVK